MLIALAVLAIAVLFLLAASFFDLKSSEIPDEVSVGLVSVVLVASLVHSVYVSDYSHIVTTVLVGAAYSAVGMALFYLGQWGGGDVKILAGIGCVFGYLNSLNFIWLNSKILPYYLVYFINMGLIAIPYVVVYTLAIGMFNKKLWAEFMAQARSRKFILMSIVSFAPSAVTLYLGMPSFALLYLLLPAFSVLSVYMKASENVLFRKNVAYNGLAVGDVVAEDVVVDGVKLLPAGNMEGMSKEQLEDVKKLVSAGKLSGEVTIKWGVKFVPIMLLAFLATVYLGNPIEILLFNLL